MSRHDISVQVSAADTPTTIATFALDLRIVRRQAGDLSYRELAARTGYSVATISRALKGETLPGWAFTEKFLRACGRAPDEIGGWKTRWIEIMDRLDPLPKSAALDHTEPPPGAECETCGAWVTNMPRHRDWHAAFFPRLVTVPDDQSRLTG